MNTTLPELEEWLTDIETAADLTSESRAKLAKVKSRGLTCTLVTEAINSDKSWDEIRDLLQLKLCNADISYLHLMLHGNPAARKGIPCSIYAPIQKTEAKRCNFMK